MPTYTDVLLDVADGIARITINRPERANALRTLTVDELTDAFTVVERDPTIRVAVLTGAGDRAFCSGGDYRDEEVGDMAGAVVDSARRLLGLSIVMRGCGKPILARIKGWAVAAGTELQAVCDLAIASDDSKLRQGGPHVGSVPAWWGAQLLPLVMGDRRAREAIFMARVYTAEEAVQAGLINLAVPADQLDATVDAWCQHLKTMNPDSLRMCKSLLNASSGMMMGNLLQGYDQLLHHHASPESARSLSHASGNRAPAPPG